MNSLRTRLLVGMIGSFALLLAAFGVLIDALIEYTLVREFDFYLETVVRTLAAAAQVEGDRVVVRLVPESLPDIQKVEGELFSQYWQDDEAVLARSKNLAEHDLPRFWGNVGHPEVQPLVLPDGRRARAAGMRFPVRRGAPIGEGALRPGGGDTYLTLVVARDTTDMESHVRQLRWLLLAAGAAAMTAGAVVSVVVIRRGLRPLHHVAASIAAIKEDDLGARIPSATLPVEVVPLVERLNELLHRLDEAFARERSLTADIAHELRTPVAGILSTAGVALSADRASAEYQEALEDVRGIARRMRSMIENLLTLARLESQPAHFQFEPIGLREMVDSCWRGFQERAHARGLAFENAVPAGLSCSSDRSAASIVFVNLLENAVEYANDAGRIWITACEARGFVEIEISNTGCQLTERQVSQVFDRFWRADPSRKDASLHAGLGLSLVRRVIASLGGAVEARAAGGNFTVSIRLQVAAPPAPVT